MPKRLWNNKLAPLPGEDLLDSLEAFMASPGNIIPVSSVADAGLLLDKAANDNVEISDTNPAFFSVGSAAPVQYVCTGKDGQDWRLVPFNEPEFYQGSWTPSNKEQHDLTLSNSSVTLLTCDIPARPYDRRVRAEASAWAYRKSGWVTFRLNVAGKQSGTDVSTSDGGGCGTSATALIPAGQTATAIARVYGTGVVRVAGPPTESWLTVSADPTRMRA